MAKEKIYGNLEYCYNGVPIVRGYCSYKFLLKYSKPHEAYQRTAEEAHVREIREYLESPQLRFMPEIVLSFNCSEVAHGEELSLVEALLQNPKKDYGNQEISLAHIGKTGINRIIRFTVDASSAPFLRRIDGNHRLEALKDYGGDDFEIPFCVIMLEADDDGERDKMEMEIFHTINAKVKPLTSTEQYRGLFELFRPDELDKFGAELPVVQRYLLSYKNLPLNNLSVFFADTIDTVMRCIKFFHARSVGIGERELADIFGDLNHTFFQEYEALRRCKCNGALVVYAYYHKTGGGHRNAKLTAFHDWFLENRLYNIAKFDPESMTEVFDNIYQIRTKQIFVAMPFDPKLEFVYDAIKSTVHALNTAYHLELPEPIRIDKQITGFSYDIVDEILRKIQSAGLLIADLTGQNANVYYEAGYAQGIVKAARDGAGKVLYLISDPEYPEDPIKAAKFDVNHYKIIPYKNDGNAPEKLRSDLLKELKAYYKIR